MSFMLLPGNGLVAESLQFFSFQSLLCSSAFYHRGGLSAFIAYSGKEELSESGQFQGLPEAIFSCLPFCLRSFPLDGMFSSSGKCYTLV